MAKGVTSMKRTIKVLLNYLTTQNTLSDHIFLPVNGRAGTYSILFGYTTSITKYKQGASTKQKL
jgi:hypothetical protein